MFTFDPGDPPEDYVPDTENTDDEVMFEWEPIYETPSVDPEEDGDSDSGSGKRPSVSFSALMEKLTSSLKKIRLPERSHSEKRRPNVNKYAVRRAVALALIVLLIAVPAISLIIKAVKGKKPVTTENVGPLPTEEIAVHRVPKYYDYSAPAPQSPEIAGYFDDALIVGDTRLVQLLPIYGIGSCRKVIYGTAINVSNALEYDSVNGDDEAETLGSALSNGRYGKIYITLGLNELGWSYPEVFQEDYDTLIQDIRKLQPNASIYLLYIVPVNEAEFKSDYITNERIKQYNGMILALAAKNGIYCVDCYTGMSDASGALASAYTSNGFYINEDGARTWWGYIASHTVDPEEYEN